MIDFASHYEFIPFSWGVLKFCAALCSLLTFYDEFNIGVVSILWPEMVPNKNLKKKILEVPTFLNQSVFFQLICFGCGRSNFPYKAWVWFNVALGFYQLHFVYNWADFL